MRRSVVNVNVLASTAAGLSPGDSALSLGVVKVIRLAMDLHSDRTVPTTF